MGAEVCRTVTADPDLSLVAAVDPGRAGEGLAGTIGVAGLPSAVTVAGSVDELDAAGIDVAVDFTVLEAARADLAWCAAHGVHAVVGTTGFSDEDLARFGDAFGDSGCLVAANFAISAVLMMRFAELAAPWFSTVEIIELHHNRKVDAPSGTSMATAERIAAASSDWASDPTTNEVLPGARGGRGPGGIPIHGVRLQGLVAHQEVLFGTTGQSLTIRQDSYDRTSFMPGVVAAIKAMPGRTGLTVGLDDIL
jgi:4-hydroxy-tetrahydrodipicolinate reductase